jgi:hypothetical protein
MTPCRRVARVKVRTLLTAFMVDADIYDGLRRRWPHSTLPGRLDQAGRLDTPYLFDRTATSYWDSVATADAHWSQVQFTRLGRLWSAG